MTWGFQGGDYAVFSDEGPYEFNISRRFGGMCRFHIQGRRNNASEEKF
jgi:hypothetical protein